MAADTSSKDRLTEVRVEETSVMDEETGLLCNEDLSSYQSFQDTELPSKNVEEPQPQKTSASVLASLSVLAIGVFVSQADMSLMLTTCGQISSEFDSFENGSWLVSSYLLAMCAAQPLYGKLSDIFGRKALLQCAYILFGIGTAVCGLGQTMGQVILGRVIAGLGGAGMVVMVSILLTDLVPPREVAAYRSYVNVVQTVGRSCGGAVGGFLAETIGWRWTLLSQCPLAAASIILVWWRFKENKTVDELPEDNQSLLTRLKRIDFLGAALIMTTISCLLLTLQLGVGKLSIHDPMLIGLITATVSAALFFCLVERYWAKEPIFPLELFTYRVMLTSCGILAIQNGLQMSLISEIPMYYQVVEGVSMAAAGAYLLPAVVGNTFGGILTGAWIKKSGRYKLPSIAAGVFSVICFTSQIIFWRGHTNIFMSLFVFFGGFATGVAHSSTFVAVFAGVEKELVAISCSGLHLLGNMGGVAGLSITSALFQLFLKSNLEYALDSEPQGAKIIKNVLSSVDYIKNLSGRVHDLVLRAYVDGFQTIFMMLLIASVLESAIGMFMKEKRLTH